MKKILVLFLLCFVAVYQVSAMPAYPRPVDYRLPDGTTINVQVFGDEFFNYTLTSDGYQVVGLEDGFLYYYTPGVGTRGVQAMRASSPRNRSNAERQYLSSLRSGVDFQYMAVGQQKADERRSKMKVNKEGEFAPFVNTVAKSRSTATRALAQRSLVIMCQYPDLKFQPSSTKAAFENLLNQEGYSKNGAIGSARDYFKDNSLGLYAPTFDVAEVVTLSHDMAYYGAHSGQESDIRPREMIIEACQLAAAAGTDFSKYDYNNDGIVDNVFVFYAGNNEAEGGPKNSIWPHRWVLNAGPSSDMSIRLNGKVIDDYACTSELKGAESSSPVMCGIGTFTHEFGHVLGLPDFYDTDYITDGVGVGLYDICVMCNGGYNGGGNIPPYYTGLERTMVGWSEMKDLATAPENLTIYPIHTQEGKDVWRIESGNKDEYFYLESRQATRWDQTLSSQGLLIYHIDRSSNNVGGVTAKSRWDRNTLNSSASHQCARLIESLGRETEAGQHGNMIYPGTNNKTFFLPGSYGFTSWGGSMLPIGLTGISQSNGTVLLRVVKKLDLGTVSGVVKDDNNTPLVGVGVTIVEVVVNQASSTPVGAISSITKEQAGAMRNSQVVYSASTDASGRYSISNLPYGQYNVMVELEGYDSYVETIEIKESMVKVDAVLNRFVATLLSKISWWQNAATGFISREGSLWVASKWDAADLQPIVGKKLGGIAVRTGSITSYQARLIVNDQIKHTSKGSTSSAGNTIVYLPSVMDITIKANDRVRVEFRVESAKSSIGLDAGPAIKGKSDLYSDNGSTWKNLSDDGVNSNVMISLLYNKDTDIPETPSVVTTTTQRQAQLEFITTDGNIQNWNLRYKVSGEEKWTEVPVTRASSYLVSNLKSNASYEGQLEALFGDKKSAAKDFTFKTATLTAQFAAIAGVKARYAAGDSYAMDCANVQSETTSVDWYWNGGKIRTESLSFSVAGKGRLDCVITYADGTKETLSREIVVE